MTIRQYKIVLKHDGGNAVIFTSAQSKAAAARIIMAAEGCPMRAIVLIERVKA